MLGVYLPIIIQVLLTLANLPIYVLAMSFLLPSIIAKFIDPVSGFADQIIVASNNQKFLSYARTCEEFGKLGLMTLFIPVFHLTNSGMQSIMWILPLGSYPATVIKALVSWWYINKKIVPVKFPWGQALIAPLAASGGVMGASYLYLALGWPALVSAWGILIAALVTVAWMLIGTFTIYMFFYGFFGGFDKAGLQVFMEAVNIAGPSKNLMKFLAFFVKLGIRISPLYGKFVIKDEVAHRQALELMYEREEVDKKVNEEKKKA